MCRESCHLFGGGSDFTYIFFYFLMELVLYKLPFSPRYIGGGGYIYVYMLMYKSYLGGVPLDLG